MRGLPNSLGVLMALAAGAVVAGGLAGCYKSSGPLVVLDGQGYGGASKAPLENIPPGTQHDPCRAELDKALRRIDKLDKDLADCKADRQRDKDEWKADKKKLERERDGYKEERDDLRKKLDKLTD